MVARRQLRMTWVQCLYSLPYHPVESALNMADQIIKHFKKKNMQNNIECREVFRDILSHLACIDAHLSPFLHQDPEHMGEIERAILRLAFYECLFKTHIDKAIIVNEAIELSKIMSHPESYRYVHGILDAFIQNQTQNITLPSSLLTPKD